MNANRPLFATILALAGCASQPASDVAAAEHAVALAQRAGAAHWSPRELALAEEKIALTRRWIAARDPAPARWLAEQAQVDAELAALKSVVARAARREIASARR